MEAAGFAVRSRDYAGVKVGRSVVLFTCEHAATRSVRAVIGEESREFTVCTSCGACRKAKEEWRDAGNLELNTCGAWPEGARIDFGGEG